MAHCKGDLEEHCCWINGKQCPHLEHHPDWERKWNCHLLINNGSWEAVYKTAEWQRDVKPFCDKLGVRCGDWPPPGEVCATCGAGDP